MNYQDEPTHDGVQMHICIQSDPLGMRAVKLDIGIWADPICGHAAPEVGEKVFVIHDVEEDKWYWIGKMRGNRMII